MKPNRTTRILYGTALLISYCTAFGTPLSAQNRAAENILQTKLQGFYHGIALNVANKNPTQEVGFCILQVFVNDEIADINLNVPQINIDAEFLGLLHDEPIHITIEHRSSCSPIVLNPEAIRPRSTFKVMDIKLKGKKLSWRTTGEGASLPFEVEQFKWNKWVIVCQVTGKGGEGPNAYHTQVLLHSGLNRFRVKQTDYTERPNISSEASIMSDALPVKLKHNIQNTQVQFSTTTYFELYTSSGKLIQKGTAQQISLSSFKAGKYYLNFGNETLTLTIP